MRRDTNFLTITDKYDIANAEAIVALDFSAVEPLVPFLLEWVQDINWPVARVLCPFLASIGVPLAPHIRRILQTSDDTWKYSLLVGVVAESTSLATELDPELQRLIWFATPGEREEGLNTYASEIILRSRSKDA